jgi:hypothetical protein
LRAVKEDFECKNLPSGGVVLIDTTCFGKDWDVVVAMDALSRKKLWRKYVRHERVADYQEGIEIVQSNGYQIFGIVCDGFRGIFSAFHQFSV